MLDRARFASCTGQIHDAACYTAPKKLGLIKPEFCPVVWAKGADQPSKTEKLQNELAI